jgi:hypothetical protein
LSPPQTSEPLHVWPAQQFWPAAPQEQVMFTQERPVPHCVPPQHASVTAPQEHIPDTQVRFGLQTDPQQTWADAPHAWQAPLTHWYPTPHAGLQPPLLPAAPPVPFAPPVPVVPPVAEAPPTPPVPVVPPVAEAPPVPVVVPPVPVAPEPAAPPTPVVTTGTSFVPGASCEVRAQTLEVVQTCGDTQSTSIWHWLRHSWSRAQMSGAMQLLL